MATLAKPFIIGLPVEIVSNILSFVDPEDLPSCHLACSFLHNTIKGNVSMFRALYLNHLVGEH